MAATDKNMTFDVNLLPVTPGDHNLGSDRLKWNLYVNQINNDTPLPSINGIYYGTCSTDAATKAKEATLINSTGFSLSEGAMVAIKFTYASAAATMTLNVNSTGAKNLYLYGTSTMSSTTTTNGWPAGAVVFFTYNGSAWIRSYWNNSTYYYTTVYCDTAANIADKVGKVSYYTLEAGKHFPVMIINANTAQSALTLNINSKGEKPIYIDGVASSSSKYTLPQGLYLVYYDGNNYYFRTDGKLTADITGNAATATTATNLAAKPSFATNSNTKITLTAGGQTSDAYTVPYATKASQDGDGNTISSTYLKLSGGTLTDALYINKNTDVVGTSDGGSLVIGTKTAENLGFDANEIMARNNKQTSNLNLNIDNSTDTSHLATVTIGGSNDSNAYVNIRYKTTASSTTSGALRVGGGAGFNGTVYATAFNGPLTGNVTGNVSGTAANVTGTVAVANGGTGKTTALDAITNLGGVYSLVGGTDIPANKNIDTDYNAMGTYLSGNNDRTKTLTGVKPVSGSGFKLITTIGYIDSQIHQFATSWGKPLYYRFSSDTGSTWSDWHRFVLLKSDGSQTVADNSGTVAKFVAIGSTTKPVYVGADSIVTACNTYAGGTAVTLNNSSKAASTASFYAPTTGGTADTQALVGNGTTAAPKWVDISPSITIGAGTDSAAPTVNVTVLGRSGTAKSITTASTSVYGVTKLQDGISSDSTTLAATAKAAYTASRNSLHTLATTTKFYLTGCTSNATNTAGDDFDTGIYTTSTAGELSAVRHTLNVSGTDKAYMVFNSTDNSIDFIFN